MTSVQPIARPLALAAAAADGAVATRLHGSPRLDGRVGVLLPAAKAWKTKWRAELPSDMQPRVVLGGGSRAVVHGTERWLLFDEEGRKVGEGNHSASARGELLLAPASNQLVGSNRYGFLVAWRLEDGGVEWLCEASGGDGFRRDLIARDGDAILLAGHHERRDPHGGHSHGGDDGGDGHGAAMPGDTRLEAIDLGSPLEMKKVYVVSRQTTGLVRLEVEEAPVAASRTALVVGSKGRLVFHDAGTLAVRAELELEDPELVPLAFSLDEADRVYLVARADAADDPHARPSLQLLTPGGERAYFFELDDLTVAPPVVGFDHRAHVVSDGHMMAYEPWGDLAWKVPLVPVGMTALPGGTLLVGAGDAVIAIDGEGERVTLASFDGEKVAAAPIVTPAGEILVATRSALHALGPA